MTGKLHYQMFFKLKEKKRSKQLAVELNTIFKGIEVQPCRGSELIARTYVTKEETREMGPWLKGRNISRFPELKKVIESPYPWQQEIETLIYSNKVDPRRIWWVMDLMGNTGKSTFTKKLGLSNLNVCLLGWS